MPNEKDYSELTDAQKERDLSIIEGIRKLHVKPLADEIRAAVPEWDGLNEWERYLALMRLNDEVLHRCREAKNSFGDSLSIDFGNYEENPRLGMYGAVYSGMSTFVVNGSGDTVIRHIAGFSQRGIDRSALDFMNTLFLNNDFERLPLPFKIAAVALHIQQSVLISHVDACRFAAGFDEEPNLRRVMISSIEADLGQVIGWNISIRDTYPDRDMLKEIAGLLRNYVSDATSNGREYIDLRYLQFAEYDPNIKQTRDLNDDTNTLYDFVTYELPSMGCYPGRMKPSGGRKLTHITWNDAFAIFEQRYPRLQGRYIDGDSFKHSYQQARKNREGR